MSTWSKPTCMTPDIKVTQVEVSAVDDGVVIVAMLKDDDEIFGAVHGDGEVFL